MKIQVGHTYRNRMGNRTRFIERALGQVEVPPAMLFRGFPRPIPGTGPAYLVQETDNRNRAHSAQRSVIRESVLREWAHAEIPTEQNK